VYYTEATNLEPLAWLISEFAAANTASMVLFVGNPTNVVICEGFGVNNAAFTAYTILPFIACCVTCLAGLAFQFRDPEHVPKTLKVSCKLDPLSVLRDRVGAVVGTIILVICLVVTIALSFLHIDVWKVVLPFAVAKFIFDLSWDHYRYSNRDASPPMALQTDEDMKAKIQRSATLPLDASISTVTTAVHTETSQTIYERTPEQSLQRRQSDLEKLFFPNVRPKVEIYADHFPTFFRALPRLPFALIPFAFSQFILIEGLAHQGWIDVFAEWLVKASHREMIPTIWLIGVLGVFLCNVAGTNIGATILLTKVIRAAQMPANTFRAAAIALAVASNIGAVSFTFSASLAGLLWDSILQDKGVKSISQRTFAFWNMLPLFLMLIAGLAVVTAEMVVLYR
jgi:Na+/H+ antiporter NhaD/arsenite permease-like protein